MDLFLFLTLVFFSFVWNDPVKLESSAALALCLTSAIWDTLAEFYFYFSLLCAKIANGNFYLFKL